MAKAKLRSLTEQDFIDICGEAPLFTVRGWAGVTPDGRLLGVGGLAFLPDGTVAMFMKATDECREKYKLFLHKAGRKAIDLAIEMKIPRVGALTEDKVPAAKRWLERLGFKSFVKHGHEVWIWQNSQL